MEQMEQYVIYGLMMLTLAHRVRPQPASSNYENGPSESSFGLKSVLQFNEIADINTLGNGSCDYNDLTLGAQICESLFFRELMNDPTGDCSKLFEALRECINSKWNECSKGEYNFRQTRSVQSTLLYYVETEYCNDGGLSPPNPSQPVNYCGIGYTDEVSTCVKEYHFQFRTNPTRESLCPLYQNARACIESAQAKMCEYPPILRYIQNNADALYKCWNPFCGMENSTSKTKSTQDISITDFTEIRKRLESLLVNSFNVYTKIYLNFYTSSLHSKGVAKECKINRAGILNLSRIKDVVSSHNVEKTQLFVNTEARKDSGEVNNNKKMRNGRRYKKISTSNGNTVSPKTIGMTRHEELAIAHGTMPVNFYHGVQKTQKSKPNSAVTSIFNFSLITYILLTRIIFAFL